METPYEQIARLKTELSVSVVGSEKLAAAVTILQDGLIEIARRSRSKPKTLRGIAMKVLEEFGKLRGQDPYIESGEWPATVEPPPRV